jgi:hypothetical protein
MRFYKAVCQLQPNPPVRVTHVQLSVKVTELVSWESVKDSPFISLHLIKISNEELGSLTWSLLTPGHSVMSWHEKGLQSGLPPSASIRCLGVYMAPAFTKPGKEDRSEHLAQAGVGCSSNHEELWPQRLLHLSQDSAAPRRQKVAQQRRLRPQTEPAGTGLGISLFTVRSSGRPLCLEDMPMTSVMSPLWD